MPNVQDNHTDGSRVLCHAKESSSPQQTSGRGGVIIKQEQESIYDAKIATCLSDNENVQVTMYTI